ncbi:MAG: WD40 repeat domain-containing protein, partial [Xenococcaceae cyanobacterium]
TSSGPIEERKVEPYYGMYRANSSVELRNLKDGSVARTFKVFYATSIAFSPDNSLIAVGNFLGEIFIWRVEDGELVSSFHGSTKRQFDKSIGKLMFSLEGQILVSAEQDGLESALVNVWDISSGQLRYSIPNRYVPYLNISPDGQFLAFGYNPLNIYRLSDGTLVRQLKINGFAKFSRDWKLVALPFGKQLHIYRLEDDNDSPVAEITLPGFRESKSISNFSFSPDGQYLALSSKESDESIGGGLFVATGSIHPKNMWSHLVLWRLNLLPNGNYSLKKQKLQTLKNNSTNSLAFSPDGKILASVGMRKTLDLWQIPPPQKSRLLQILLTSTVAGLIFYVIRYGWLW